MNLKQSFFYMFVSFLVFFNVENISYFLPRRVFVIKKSINSVVVHDAPEDPFQQLLVAAFLSTNARGNAQ